MFDKNIIITKKHSAYMDLLKENGFFRRHLDIYICAAIVGFQYNRKGTQDSSEAYKDKKTTIFTEQLITEASMLQFIFRLIMLLEGSNNVPLEDRVNRAFRDDSLNDVSGNHEKNMKTFNEYVYGGIEVLYEKIIGKGITKQDFMTNAYEFMKEQHYAFTSADPEELLKSL